MQDSERHKSGGLTAPSGNVWLGELLWDSVSDPPLPLLPAALRVDEDEQRVSVRHGADLLGGQHVGIISRVALICRSDDKTFVMLDGRRRVDAAVAKSGAADSSVQLNSLIRSFANESRGMPRYATRAGKSVGMC